MESRTRWKEYTAAAESQLDSSVATSWRKLQLLVFLQAS
jgi:hypothetical protein